MGDLRRTGDLLQHNAAPRGAPEDWVTIKFDEAGTPFEVHEATGAVLDRDTQRVVLAVGGLRVSMPADVAAQVTAGLAKYVPDAKAAEVDAAIAQQAARLSEDRLQREAEADAAIAEKRAEVDRLDAELAAKRAEKGIGVPDATPPDGTPAAQDGG